MFKQVLVITISVVISIGCATGESYVSFDEVAESEPLPSDEFERLERRVGELESTFNVEARADHRIYFEYADALIREGAYDLALEHYLKGLRLNAFDLDAQVRAAELEIRLDQENSALQRLEYVMQSSEDGQRKQYAEQLIESYSLQGYRSDYAIPDRRDLVLHVLPVGDVAQPFLQAVESRIEQEFRVTVEIHSAVSVPEDMPTRNSLAAHAGRVIDDIESINTPAVMRDFYESIGLEPSGPQSASETMLAYRELVLQEDDGEEQWQAIMEDTHDQYDANALLGFVARTTSHESSSDESIGVLGITSHDLYREDLNYLFALTRTGTGIMSTHRFFRPERDTLSEGVHRTVVQAMTSYIQILGLTRASSIPCATAYPHSLAEFDQKEDTLCAETVEQVVQYYESR